MKARAILKKTVHVGLSTLISRLLGLTRDALLARYIGGGALADAFIAAYQIPNSLRKMFAEGALSASFIPTLIHVLTKEGQKAANRFMTLLFLVVQIFLLIFCLSASYYAAQVIKFAQPGWFTPHAGELAAYALVSISLLRILIFFIMFLSANALFAGALQAKGFFVISSLSQVFLNIPLIVELLACLRYNLPIYLLAVFFLINGALLMIINMIAYRYAGFQSAYPDKTSWTYLWLVLQKFLPCLVSVGALEVNLYIDGMLASYLPAGSRSLLYYASAYLRIPTGIVAVAFASVALPYFARIGATKKQRLSFYLYESTKFMLWVMIPATLLMLFFAKKIFVTVLLSEKFTMAHVIAAQQVLMAFSSGLFFFSMNKVLLNMYYAMHSTVLPSLIVLFSTICNTLLSWFLMKYWGVTGIAFATACASGLQTILLAYVLHKLFYFRLYLKHLSRFALAYAVQLSIFSALFYALFFVLESGIQLLPSNYVHILLATPFYWIWAGPLTLVMLSVLFLLHKKFGIRLHFVM